MFVIFRKSTHKPATKFSLASSLPEAESIFLDVASKIGQVLVENTSLDENKFTNDQVVFVKDKNELNSWIEQKVIVSAKDTGVLWSNIQKECKLENVANWWIMEIPNTLINDWLLNEEKKRCEELTAAQEVLNLIKKARTEREKMEVKERDTLNLGFIKSKYQVKSTDCMDFSLAKEIQKSLHSLSGEAKLNLREWCRENSKASDRLDLINLLAIIYQNLGQQENAYHSVLYAAEHGYPLAISNLLVSFPSRIDSAKWIAKLKETGYKTDIS
jgi:hypothetical protein